MASIIAWLIGFLLLGVGCYILLLRFEGLVDRIKPHNLTIGQMTVDGKESKGYAELLRARFNHHFRQPVAIPKETGFLEVVTLDAPELFQAKEIDGALKKMTFEVSGVNVSKLLQLFNHVAKPEQWVVEGDLQSQSDRALLALRLRRGERLIRTWYLERLARTADNKAMLLEQLIDDAIFQLVYDFGNKSEQDKDLRKWRRLVPLPTAFPSRAAVAAYFEARGALGRYYAHGDWNDLDAALERLQTLRGQMPEYANGLQLLAMALAEKRKDTEAIHVYEQLRLLLLPSETKPSEIDAQLKRRLFSIDLLKATATAKLYTWQSAHEAIGQLLQLAEMLEAERAPMPVGMERTAYSELLAQTAVQLASTYSLYMPYIRHYTVREVFGNPEAPKELRINDAADINALKKGGSAEQARRIVLKTIKAVADQYKNWIDIAAREQTALETKWQELLEGSRRRAELISRLHLAKGHANLRMAEWEDRDADRNETIFGETFDTRLQIANRELSKADAAHPNHYLVLQLLGLVHSEPRYEDKYLNIAEQYFQRAIRANHSDHFGHELLAGLLKRRVANRGVDLASSKTIQAGLKQAETAIHQREISGRAHLLRAEFQTMLLEIERDPGKRQQLKMDLKRYINQADRFLPRAFGRPHPDLTWIRIVAATRSLGEAAESKQPLTMEANELEQLKLQRFDESKNRLKNEIDQLIEDCNRLQRRWVAHQRVYLIKSLADSARRLRIELSNATLANWQEIQIPFH
jgi:hypothetical protein